MFESGVTEALKLVAATSLDGLPHALNLPRKGPPAGRSTIRRFRCWALTPFSDIHATSASNALDTSGGGFISPLVAGQGPGVDGR